LSLPYTVLLLLTSVGYRVVTYILELSSTYNVYRIPSIYLVTLLRNTITWDPDQAPYCSGKATSYACLYVCLQLIGANNAPYCNGKAIRCVWLCLSVYSLQHCVCTTTVLVCLSVCL